MPTQREDRHVGWSISQYGMCSHYSSTKHPRHTSRGPALPGTFSLACCGTEAGACRFFDDFSYKYVSGSDDKCIVRVVEGVHVYLSTRKIQGASLPHQS